MTPQKESTGKHLSFTLGSEEYAIPVQCVREIVGPLPVTRVPSMPPHVLGVINLRGKVIPLADLRIKIGIDAHDHGARTCIVVVQLKSGLQLGLVVDSVSEVLQIAAQEFDRSTNVGSGGQGVVGLAKVRNHIKILIDVEQLLHEESEALSSAA
jgi:purine-binding chemotaxis protein CheW